ncbi:MAG: phosphoenolpyruvate--protein phosphotransferase [Gemmatimonas sp.]
MESPAAAGPRQLLRRLRDMMAAKASAQERLNEMVRIIAADMVAEVCSIYIRRAGDVLELFATQGLNPQAVHRTRLRVGEGLVGDIAAHARPLSLSDAQAHPQFAYRPETGEEIYHSFMGVPIVQAGRVVGVLTVQNKTRRTYDDDEVEALQIIAMVLAELAASGELVTREERTPQEGIALLPTRMEGVRFSGGVGVGQAVLHQPSITIRQIVAEDPDAELKRLEEAVTTMHGSLEALLDTAGLQKGEHQDVLEAYRMIAMDPGWIERIRDAVRTGLTAEAAVQQVRENTRARMSQVADHYLRERLGDLEELAVRLLQHLTGESATMHTGPLPDSMIIVARTLGPAELLEYDTKKVRALVLEEGSPTAHVCIVARALDIPILGLVDDALIRVDNGDLLIVDAESQEMFVRPGEDIQQVYSTALSARAQQRQRFVAIRERPAVSRDGARVRLLVNAGLELEVEQVATVGAEGVGLYRTEIPFMVRAAYPEVQAQMALYRSVFEKANGRTVVFRTLDVGGDKVLPYFDRLGDENPAMGWRALRIALDRPAMLRNQVRALIRAAEGRPLHVMFPMVTEVAEFERAKAILTMELERERGRANVLPAEVKVGAMIEVPALLFQLKALLARVDFLSVGSNDLLQFLFAADRGNPRIAPRYDTLAPAALRVFASLIEGCEAAQVPLSICGEMAGTPLEAMALVGLGIRSLSMSPLSVPQVKAMILSLDASGARRYIMSLLDSPDRSLRDKLRAFARDHGVAI